MKHKKVDWWLYKCSGSVTYAYCFIGIVIVVTIWSLTAEQRFPSALTRTSNEIHERCDTDVGKWNQKWVLKVCKREGLKWHKTTVLFTERIIFYVSWKLRGYLCDNPVECVQVQARKEWRTWAGRWSIIVYFGNDFFVVIITQFSSALGETLAFHS